MELLCGKVGSIIAESICIFLASTSVSGNMPEEKVAAGDTHTAFLVIYTVARLLDVNAYNLGDLLG